MAELVKDSAQKTQTDKGAEAHPSASDKDRKNQTAQERDDPNDLPEDLKAVLRGMEQFTVVPEIKICSFPEVLRQWKDKEDTLNCAARIIDHVPPGIGLLREAAHQGLSRLLEAGINKLVKSSDPSLELRLTQAMFPGGQLPEKIKEQKELLASVRTQLGDYLSSMEEYQSQGADQKKIGQLRESWNKLEPAYRQLVIDKLAEVKPYRLCKALQDLQLAELELKARNQPCAFQPEYEDTLENLAMVIRPGIKKEASEAILKTQLELISKLPNYTCLTLLTDEGEEGEVRSLMEKTLGESAAKRVTIISVNTSFLDHWIQDLSEGNNRMQVMPMRYLGGGEVDILDLYSNEFLRQLESPNFSLLKVPVLFAGGNVSQVHNKDGQKLLLVGTSCYLSSKDYYEKLGKSCSIDYYRSVLGQAFDAEQVRLIGPFSKNLPKRQHPNLFHQDQVLLPLGKGIVAITNLKGPAEIANEAGDRAQKEFNERWKGKVFPIEDPSGEITEIATFAPEEHELKKQYEQEKRELDAIKINLFEQRLYKKVAPEVEQIREQLSDFSFINLDTSMSNVRNFQSYANSIVYRHKDTQEMCILMPIFPGEDANNKKNQQTLSDAGFKVTPVTDYGAFKGWGNIHCLTIRGYPGNN